jgi:hypothetical protein
MTFATEALKIVVAAVKRHRETRWGAADVLDVLDARLYAALARDVDLLTIVRAIERHRDDRYHGAGVTDRADATLYEAALWVRDMEQELGADGLAP